MNNTNSAIIGPAKVFKISDNRSEITRDILQHLPIEKGDRVLFRTKNSDIDDGSIHLGNYVYLSTDAIKYLVEKEVSCVGIDHLLVNNGSNAEDIKQMLAAVSISLIEGLKLNTVEPGAYEMICLPLPAKNTGMPQSRIILKPGGDAAQKAYAGQ